MAAKDESFGGRNPGLLLTAVLDVGDGGDRGEEEEADGCGGEEGEEALLGRHGRWSWGWTWRVGGLVCEARGFPGLDL